MFMGEYAHNIDRKGRLIMPAKFREELGEHVVVNRGLDGCLYVYTVEQWQQVYQKLSTLPSTNKDARMYQRMMLSKAAECVKKPGLPELSHRAAQCRRPLSKSKEI